MAGRVSMSIANMENRNSAVAPKKKRRKLLQRKPESQRDILLGKMNQ